MNRSIIFVLLMLSSCSAWKRGAGTKLNSASSSTFDKEERSLILSASADSSMRVLLITHAEDSVILRTKSLPVKVDPRDTVLQYFAKRLYATVRDPAHPGVGIAAPQVGVLKQIIWVQRFDKEGFPFELYYNPRIEKYTDLKQRVMEGCLSIPNIRDTLQSRAYAILLRYENEQGERICEMVEDFTAVIFQHEIDHLQGILFTDHLEKERMAGGRHKVD